MEGKNYDEAEKLCLEKANAEEIWHYHCSDPKIGIIYYMIYIRQQTTRKSKSHRQKTAIDGNEKFWDVLKQIFNDCGAWNENYESLLDELKDSKRTVCYRSIPYF